MSRPNFFIVGAPKCGTSAMNSYLRQHPDIFMPEIKELHFFGNDLNRGSASRYTEDEYQMLFQSSDSFKRIGESSVLYLYSKQAPYEIYDFSPEAKIIIMLRSPVDMLFSLHAELLFLGHEEITNFTQALEAEPERRAGRMLPESTLIREMLYYSEMAQFSEHVSRYFNIFGRDNVHVVLFDDFNRDVAETYRGVLEFLGVDKSFQPLFTRVNARKQPHSLALSRLLANPPSLLRRIVRASFGRPLRHRIATYLLHLNAKPVPHIGQKPELLQSLRRELQVDIDQLCELIGRDLSGWET